MVRQYVRETKVYKTTILSRAAFFYTEAILLHSLGTASGTYLSRAGDLSSIMQLLSIVQCLIIICKKGRRKYLLGNRSQLVTSVGNLELTKGKCLLAGLFKPVGLVGITKFTHT